MRPSRGPSAEESRAEFVAQLRWRLRLDYDGLRQPDAPELEYFDRALLQWRGGVFVDGGAFDGDTLQRFVAWTGGDFDAAIGIEADPSNLARLRANLDALPDDVARRIRVAPWAVAGQPGTLRFSSLGTGASAVSAAGDVVIEARTLEAIVGDLRPTYIKLDIEGAEIDVLTAGRDSLARWRCTVAACCYHAPDHLWRVPGLLLAAMPDATLKLRSYGSEAYDLVAYAVPSG